MAEKEEQRPLKKKVKPKDQPEKEVNQTFELARLRSNFYRDNYRRLILAMLLVLFGVVIMAYGLIYQYTHKPSPTYFVTNTLGQILPLEPLNKSGEPALSTAEVVDWTRRAVTSAFSFDYVQWQQQIELTTEIYFTDTGGQQYQKQLQLAGYLTDVKNNKLIMTSKVNGNVLLYEKGNVESGNKQGNYYWRIKMPIAVTMENINVKRTFNLEVDVRVIRDEPVISQARGIDALRGIVVENIVAKDANPFPGATTAT